MPIEGLELRMLLSAYALSSISGFGTSDSGAYPDCKLVADSSGNLYGTTSGGGAYGYGTVFKIAAGRGNVQVLASFDVSNGTNPRPGVALDSSGNLFGTTSAGGSSDLGTVFEIANGTGTIRTIVSFNGTDGASPWAGLTLDGSGNLYGTTSGGGAYGYGTVFKIVAANQTLQTLASFNGASGANPRAGVTLDSQGNIYGTTEEGGQGGYGVVFEIVKSTGTLQTLASFDYWSSGANPRAGVTLDGSGNLYGSTIQGGSGREGTVFEIARGSGTIQTLAWFDGRYGGSPSQVTLDSTGNLYGTTAGLATYRDGTVFEVAKASGTVQILASFNGSNGATPASAGVTFDGSGNLYGATSRGGAFDSGTVFKITMGTGMIQTLASFDVTNGTYPRDGVTLDGGGNLFGTSSTGGSSDAGTVFEIASGTGTIRTIAWFKGTYAGPSGLTLDGNGNLFGTTYGGGDLGDGSVFEIPHGAGDIQTIASFTGTNGARPSGGVTVVGNGNLYGTTEQGGSSGHGTVFEIVHGTATIITVAAFTSFIQGRYPNGVVLDGNGNIYGTTAFGGSGSSAGYGTVFEIPAGTDTIQTLALFDGPNGINPSGVILDASGNLYGTTSLGGAYGYGTVFEIARGTNMIQTLASFDRTNGARPGGVTLDTSGNLYGTTSQGGFADAGTIFEIAHGSGVVKTLATFNETNGAAPSGGVTRDDSGNLYGTTEYGGISDFGTVFKLTPPVPGDVNGDRSVNFADLLILSQHYGRPATPDQGDLDEDGTVGFDDLLILAQNYGRNEPAGWGSPAASTPSDPHNPAVAKRRARGPRPAPARRPPRPWPAAQTYGL